MLDRSEVKYLKQYIERTSYELVSPLEEVLSIPEIASIYDDVSFLDGKYHIGTNFYLLSCQLACSDDHIADEEAALYMAIRDLFHEDTNIYDENGEVMPQFISLTKKAWKESKKETSELINNVGLPSSVA